MARAFIFPGQGSQYVGMGKELAENFASAKEVFDEVDSTLNQKLFELMTNGPDEQLNLTENTQPALMAVSVAVMRVLEKDFGMNLKDHAKYVAGHSLGEYSALTAAGSIQLSDTAKLLRIRGQAMQEAVPVGQGTMAAILGLNFEDVQAITVKASSQAGVDEICESANDYCEGQIVVSGHVGAVQAAIALATEKGARKAIQLPVSAPFHCTLMTPAAEKMAEALSEADVKFPAIPVVANVTASEIIDPDKIRQLLIQQITGMVRWRESVLFMKENDISEMHEIGSGKVLSGLVRRIDRNIKCSFAETPSQIENLASSLK